MSSETLFYVCGGALAVSAVLVSLIGLRIEDFPGRFAPLVALWFIVLVGSAASFAVLHAQDEQKAKAAEFSQAGEEAESAESGAPAAQPEAESETAPKPQPGAKGQGETTLQLSASPTKIAFDTTELRAKSGKVTIDFANPAALEHDVAIEQNGKPIAQSALIAKGKTSVSADLAPGTYTFLCTVPGHAEAGMEGTLTVK
jgi:plastocyanin